ncbi:MAG: glycosyltransferase family 2 protein, partial [Lachnospiraceae bacterium]|nr:glycosyltransferase family 2 protein [Lachnospiraceae bacterium]
MRCLRSIPVSEDIQVIVVDDNSVGADTYLERYSELSRPYLEFVRTTKGGGAGYARNVGLEHAKGKWILFADADDFFVDDMSEIIYSLVDSEADVIYFKNKAVLSDNISIRANRSSYLNVRIDQYLADGDEWPVRFKTYVPWCKLIKRNLIVKNDIRFDELMYSNDVYFSLLTGYYSKIIEVVTRVLYVVTARSNSLAANFCSKPGELEQRAEVAFRRDVFLLQHDACREMYTPRFMKEMLRKDRSLLRHYYERLNGLFPSKLSA